MAHSNPGFRIGAVALIATLTLGACGGRLGASARADEPDTAGPAGATAGPTTAPTAEPATDPTPSPPTDPKPSATPGDEPTPASSPAPSPKATPKPTTRPTPAPAPTPDLAQLEQLLGQLDAALAADETATQDEGSPE